MEQPHLKTACPVCGGEMHRDFVATKINPSGRGYLELLRLGGAIAFAGGAFELLSSVALGLMGIGTGLGLLSLGKALGRQQFRDRAPAWVCAQCEAAVPRAITVETVAESLAGAKQRWADWDR